MKKFALLAMAAVMVFSLTGGSVCFRTNDLGAGLQY